MTATAFPLQSPASQRLPRIGRLGLICFLWVLPFHSVFIALLFGYFGVDADTTRAIAAWKEIAVLLFVIWVVFRALLSKGPGAEIMSPDVAVTALIGIAIVFVLVANPVFNARIPVGAELYGFRDSVFFMLLYYVGRTTPEMAESDTVMKHAFFIALVVSVLGILERAFLSLDMIAALGVASYLNDFLGLSAYAGDNELGLPLNYWTWLGGVPVRRAGSVFLHSQGFALPFLFLIPAATAWALSRRQKHPILVRIAYVIIWIGLLVSITRMTTVICVLQVALFFLIMRRPEWTLGSGLATIAMAVVAVAIVPGLLQFLWETLTWQTVSGTSHLRDWSNAAVSFFEQPWGHGVGTTDSAPLRFFRVPLSTDNMYLSYAVQMGVAGVIALIVTLGSILTVAWRTVWTAATDAQRRFAAVIALTTIGIILNGITSSVFSSNFLAYVFFWQAGALVTMAQRLPTARNSAGTR